jgi:hypothetical protein
MGVGKVDAVTADLGVVMYTEAGVKGVNGVRVLGESSVFALRGQFSEGLLLLLPERSRLSESW